MKKILAIIGVIILVICIALAGCIDSEERSYLESTPKAELKSRIIRH